MNTMNENAQAMTQATITSLTEAVTAIATQLKDLVDLAKAESTVAVATTTEVTTTETTATTTTEATTATEATETTTTATTPIVVIDDDDNVIATSETTTETTTADVGFKGSMNEQNPMDLIPAAEAKADTAAEAKADTAAEAKADDTAEEYLDNISCDISTLYDISTYTLENEGYNIGTDHSPYAPMDNRSASFDNYKVYMSKEIIKSETDVTGEFRMIVSEKNSGVKIMDHSLKIINDHIKVSSSENTVRMDKIKDSKKLFRLLEIVEEVSALVMSKYSK